MSKNDFEARQHKSGLIYELLDAEAYALDEHGWVSFEITKPNDNEARVFLDYETDWEVSSFKFNWEPDHPSTTVPYGDQWVSLDDGEGGLESVETNVECIGYKFLNGDDPDIELDEDEVQAIFGCTEEDLFDIIKETTKLAVKHTEDKLEEYYDDPWNWPEKPEDEPDYDDWRDVEWD